MPARKKTIMVYSQWHPGMGVAQLLIRNALYFCATYHKEMDMRGYRPYILEYEEVNNGI